jgi:hypothetical protein
MEQGVLEFFITQGPWALLFVMLFFYVLKQNAKREDRLISCLEELSAKYDTIAKDVGEIKELVKFKK